MAHRRSTYGSKFRHNNGVPQARKTVKLFPHDTSLPELTVSPCLLFLLVILIFCRGSS